MHGISEKQRGGGRIRDLKLNQTAIFLA